MTPLKKTIPQLFQVKFLAALAVVALFATLVAVGMTTGTTQAQQADNTYAPPQPCGPHAGTANQPEPHEITQGHFALFDSYWWNDETTEGQGVLYVNRCPPKMVTTKKTNPNTGKTTVTTARAASGIDIAEAIFHVTDDFSVDVVANNADVTAKGELSLEEYPDVRRALGLFGPANELLPIPEGTKVWWLRLDDPDTTKVEESDMTVGFSTALFESQYWLGSADGQPMRYMFESKRYPSIESPDDERTTPKKVPHFLTYEAPTAGAAKPVRIWDSTAAHTNAMEMEPGEYRPTQWIFTQPGTYFVESHLVGHVRETNPLQPTETGYDANWKRISSDKTEAAETATYVFQVKDLDEMEPPVFGVYHDIKENTPPGTKLGDPIRVFESEAETLQYSLTGTGNGDFALMPTTNPHAVQLAVASGVNLDFERQRSYDLTLGVTDLIDHESNPNSTIDDSLKVEVDLQDIARGVTLRASDTNPDIGDAVTLTAELTDVGPYNTEWIRYTFQFSDTDDRPNQEGNTYTVTRSSAGAVTIGVTVSYARKGAFNLDDGSFLFTEIVVTWGNP